MYKISKILFIGYVCMIPMLVSVLFNRYFFIFPPCLFSFFIRQLFSYVVLYWNLFILL